jgi:hypothetical protein
MIYRELLVMRKALTWYFIVVFALCVWAVFWLWSYATPGSHSSIDVGFITGPIAWSVSVFPAIFGVALGNGSREASRVLWTLPVARWVFALRTIAVDLGAIVVAFAGTFVLALLVFAAQGLRQPVELRASIDWASVATAIAFLFALYGWAALTGMLGRRVPYLGIAAYPFLLVWWIFSNARGPIGDLLRTPLILNPAAVFATVGYRRPDLGALGNAVVSLGPAWQFSTLAAIFVLTCAASVYLWQRAEVVS